MGAKYERNPLVESLYRELNWAKRQHSSHCAFNNFPQSKEDDYGRYKVTSEIISKLYTFGIKGSLDDINNKLLGGQGVIHSHADFRRISTNMPDIIRVEYKLSWGKELEEHFRDIVQAYEGYYKDFAQEPPIERENRIKVRLESNIMISDERKYSLKDINVIIWGYGKELSEEDSNKLRNKRLYLNCDINEDNILYPSNIRNKCVTAIKNTAGMLINLL